MVNIRVYVEEELDINGGAFEVIYYIWEMSPLETRILRGFRLPENIDIVEQDVAEDLIANDPNNFHYNYVLNPFNADDFKYTTKEVFEELIRLVENELNLIDFDEELPELPENR